MYLEHAMEAMLTREGSKAEMEAMLENYDRKDEVDVKINLLRTEVSAMAITEVKVREILTTEYVPKEALDQQITGFVTPVVNAKVAEAIATDEINNKISQIAEAAVTRSMQEKIQFFDDKIAKLRTEVGNLADSRKPTQDDAKEEEDKGDDEKGEDSKDKEINEIKK